MSWRWSTAGWCQAYGDWLIRHAVRRPDKYAAVPAAEVPTRLSARWQRCAWQQACGIVRSWYSNERVTPPVLRNGCLQANANVVVIEPSANTRLRLPAEHLDA